MTDERVNNGIDDDSGADDADMLATLLTLAGPNAPIDDEIKNRVYGNVRRQWVRSHRRSYSKLNLLRWGLPAALAAGVLIVAIVREPVSVSDARPIGTVARVTSSTGGAGFVVGREVRVGEILDTSSGEGLGIRLRNNTSLRLDGNSLLKVDSADEFTLLLGQVYADTGIDAYAKKQLTIHTASGSAVDIGTQFSVGFRDADMSIAVREGRVDVTDSLEKHEVSAGAKLVLRPGAGARFESIPISGTSWDWAITLAPSFEIEGRSLMDFLKWASREMGYELEFVDDEQRMAAMRTRLRGPAEGLDLENLGVIEAIDMVLSTTRFSYTIEDRVLSVSR